MNILVVLRPVRDPASFTVNRRAEKIFVKRESFVINPADRNALEAALALASEGDNVTALALGGEPAREVLQQARATGAARALWVETEPGTPALDAGAAARVVQHVVDFLGAVDLVLLGAEVLDADLAQVGPRLAAALDWPFVDGAHAPRRLPTGEIGLVVAAAAGAYRLLGVTPPAVASVARDSNQPRYAPAAQIITTYQSPDAVERVELADLGLDPDSLAPATTVRGESFPPERSLGRLVEDDGAVRQLAAAIRNLR